MDDRTMKESSYSCQLGVRAALGRSEENARALEAVGVSECSFTRSECFPRFGESLQLLINKEKLSACLHSVGECCHPLISNLRSFGAKRDRFLSITFDREAP